MSEIDHSELRRLAENATPGPVGYTFERAQALRDMQAHLDPPTVIALLDRIEVLRSVVIGDWESEYAVQWVETDGLPVTEIGADREDIAALVESQDGWAREVCRFVGPWVPVPEQTDSKTGRSS